MSANGGATAAGQAEATVATDRHAGVESGGLNLVVFDSTDQLARMLSAIGMVVEADGTLREPKGEIVHCESCAKGVELSEVGHVMPGSYMVYCNNPVCILDYLERFG